MGRGGRSSSGGSRSHSSGGSRGFSSHSSSSRSSSRGGRSSGRSYHRSSGHSTIHYGPRYRSSHIYVGGGYGGVPFSIGIFFMRMLRTIFIGILIFIVIVALGLANVNRNSDITKSTVERTKLESDLVNETDYYYEDTLGWISSSYTLEEGMKDFYSKTGVQPYLYICDNLDGVNSYSEVNSQTVQEEFGNRLYDSLFNDEGHLLLVFCEYDFSEYVSFCIVGTSAKTVMDEEAREILLDYIDHYYYSDYEDDEYFSKAFSAAGERIMKVEKSHTWIIVLAVIILLALIILINFFTKRREKKLQQMQAAQNILNTPLDQSAGTAEDLARKYDNNNF